MLKTLEPYIHSICIIGDILWKRGWAEMNAGNISIDVTDQVDISQQDRASCPTVKYRIPYASCAQHQYLVTVAGARFRDMSRDPNQAIMLIDIPEFLDHYTILQCGRKDAKATSELATHLAGHAHLSESGKPERAVLHAHPTHLIALTHIADFADEEALSQLLVSMHPELLVALPEGIGFVPYSCPGKEQLAKNTMVAIQKHRVAVWEKHGCLSIGDTIEQAFDRMDIVNKAAETFFLGRSAGHELEGISEKDLGELKRTFGKM